MIFCGRPVKAVHIIGIEGEDAGFGRFFATVNFAEPPECVCSGSGGPDEIARIFYMINLGGGGVVRWLGGWSV